MPAEFTLARLAKSRCAESMVAWGRFGDAAISLLAERRWTRSTANPAPTSTPIIAARCARGKLVRADKDKGEYWFCSGYKKGCKVKVDDHEGRPKPAHRCKKCGQLLVKREGKNGPFWGCSSYPVCAASYSDSGGQTGFMIFSFLKLRKKTAAALSGVLIGAGSLVGLCLYGRIFRSSHSLANSARSPCYCSS